MKGARSLLLLLMPCMFGTACVVRTETLTDEYEYGKKIKYADRQTKRLPDLSIRFLTERKESSHLFRPGFTFYDFEVTKDGAKQVVSWSSGTGDIGPTYFHVGVKEFVLELKASVAYKGFLDAGEMVVWKKEVYEKLSNR